MRPNGESTITPLKSRANNLIVSVDLLQITKPIISGLSVKPRASENSCGLNCQFDISSCVRAFISYLKKIPVLQFKKP